VLHDLFHRLRSLFRGNSAETELDDELRFHFERYVQKYERSGVSRDEALRRARIEFGGLDQVKEECREARGVHVMEELVQDVRYGLRMLRKSPGFTAVALLTLALGIGANTAIFSVVYGILLRPLPYQDPSRLIVLNESTPRVGLVSVSYPDFQDWRVQSHAFSQIAAVGAVTFNLAGVNQPENISGEAVSSNFFSILGMHPLLGRDFAPAEEKLGTAPVVLLTYQLWQSHLGGDPNVLGHTINLDGNGFTIVGVLPPDFRSIDKTDVIVPMGVWATHNPEEVADRSERGDMRVIARLAPGVSFQQARAEMDTIQARLAATYPVNTEFGASLRPIREVFVGEIRPAILVLFGAVLFVLLIACANVANLFLMRGAARTREIALRIALGATRGRIVRQMLAESLVLAFFGGLLGVSISIAGIRGLSTLIVPMDMQGGASATLSGAVLLFAAVAVVVSSLMFGLVPALQLTKPEVQSELKEGGRSSSAGRGQSSVRGFLAVAEMAVALILLVGAGLMVQSLHRLLAVDPGFQTHRLLTMEMNLRTAQYSKNPAVLNFWQQTLEKVRALPGVESAALGTAIPLSGSHSRSDISIEGIQEAGPGKLPHPDIHIVSPGYVRTLGVPLLRGREFTEADTENSPLVGMINAMLARQFFPHEDAVGKRFTFGKASAQNPPRWITIVGVTSETKLYGLANPARLEVYLPHRQSVTGDMNLIVKSAADPAALTSAIRLAIGSIDKDQPIFSIATMQELVDSSVSTRRVTLILLALFSALALVLAAVGIYGVISYSVAQRTHEIGIRMALGAERGGVVRMILAQGAKIAGAGVAIGIAASLGLTRLMTNLLFSVSAADPVTFGAVALVLILVALLACYIPARRALRVDPIIALRYE